jgi:uncharacterized protein (DUF433 family)
MTLSITAEPTSLEVNADGVIRVGGKRVTLGTVVAAFNQGATPEEIVFQYPSLQRRDVYVAIAYYLRHQQDVGVYLQQRQQRASEIRQQNEAAIRSQRYNRLN